MTHLDLNSAETNLLGANAESVAAAANLPDSGVGGRFGNYEELMQLANLIESGRVSREKVDVGTKNAAVDNSFGDYMGADQSTDSIYEPSNSMMPGIFPNKMISLTKSKEFKKLANQVPSIYSVKGGQTHLSPRDRPIDKVSSKMIQGSMTGPVLKPNLMA